ncbi:hypothetical protein GGI25_003509 [Coemansia spiralis]|uniref:Uncharacterized protein n=2 Tax=Coemansia TaxID=4863 RepID=A0A9W8KXG1_9FUNG|nr:hypothetical protein BX070DRAFT_253361 [Coemansia spiralis]KAJ1986145.1 hypothetical protein EDC05_006401 [Coemansia umbellata]KAJ2622113.1 hypothetical protein GGI26_003555 [Coemansia sp. RSA 1358]KAJ2676474.1 hypothetical protein GGI25_003509 [Coemansia spiralis]
MSQALLSTSSTTAVSIISTVSLTNTATYTVEPSTYTSASTHWTTVTQTVTPPAGSTTVLSYDSLTTYTTAYTTEYQTITATATGNAPSTGTYTTTIVGGTGEVGGITIIGVIYEIWMYFLCPSRDCSPWREWLTYIPNVGAGWAIGAIALLLGLLLLFMAFKCGGLEYIFGFLAMAILCICLFLRGALKSSSGDKFAMYKASVWLDYFAPVLLALLIAQLIFRLVIHLDNTLCNTVRALVGFVYVVAIALFAVLTAGVVMMFDKHSVARMQSGIQCIQAFTIIVLVVAVILLIAALWASTNDHRGHHMGHVIIIVLCTLFLIVWGSFMTARAFLDLHSAARHSEALWYIFNIVPLLLIAIVLLALNAPAMFTFCHCPVNMCPVSNPHVRYSTNAGQAYTHSHDRQMEANVAKYYM